MPVFPDFKVRFGMERKQGQLPVPNQSILTLVSSISQMWINPCAQVIFDSDPAPKDTSGAAALEMMSQAMIRSVVLLYTLACCLLPLPHLGVFEIGYGMTPLLRLTSNSWHSSCLNLWKGEFTGMSHHTQLCYFFAFDLYFLLPTTRGMMDEEGNQFVAYFLPVEETLKKRKRDQEEEMDYAPDDV